MIRPAETNLTPQCISFGTQVRREHTPAYRKWACLPVTVRLPTTSASCRQSCPRRLSTCHTDTWHSPSLLGVWRSPHGCRLIVVNISRTTPILPKWTPIQPWISLYWWVEHSIDWKIGNVPYLDSISYINCLPEAVELVGF